MKFWKPALITTLLFSAFIITVLYTACEKDPCNNVTCYNAGSCGNGICHCPTGYENTQCETKSVARYIGAYGGDINCNEAQEVIDSAFIYADTSSPAMLNYVWIVWKRSNMPIVLHGYVYNNESVYSIVVPNTTANNYIDIYTVTLQNWGNAENNKLIIHSYEKNTQVPGDTVINSCTFIGLKD